MGLWIRVIGCKPIKLLANYLLVKLIIYFLTPEHKSHVK